MCCLHSDQELVRHTFAASLALIGHSVLAAAHEKRVPAPRVASEAQGTQLGVVSSNALPALRPGACAPHLRGQPGYDWPQRMASAYQLPEWPARHKVRSWAL